MTERQEQETQQAFPASLHKADVTVRLMREIGFLINDNEELPGLSPYIVLRLIVSGLPDPVTGYLVNVHTLDAVLRKHAIPTAVQLYKKHGPAMTGEHLLGSICDQVRPYLPTLCTFESLTLQTTPLQSYSICAGAPSMVELTHCFEFSASHRLHVASLSEKENRRIFGKCNNPKGHGHNYQLDISIRRDIHAPADQVLPTRQFEAIVMEKVINRFDHAHLNDDVPEFASLNPSVENIARVVWDLLSPSVSPATLSRIRVWETARTYAEYAGVETTVAP